MKVTKMQLMSFFGSDTIEDICDYLPILLNQLQDNEMSIKEFIDSFKPRDYETLLAISNHFFLRLDEVRDNGDDVCETYSIKVDANRWLHIEWCEENSETIKELGKDCFSKVRYNKKTYYWRWL